MTCGSCSVAMASSIRVRLRSVPSAAMASMARTRFSGDGSSSSIRARSASSVPATPASVSAAMAASSAGQAQRLAPAFEGGGGFGAGGRVVGRCEKREDGGGGGGGGADAVVDGKPGRIRRRGRRGECRGVERRVSFADEGARRRAAQRALVHGGDHRLCPARFLGSAGRPRFGQRDQGGDPVGDRRRAERGCERGAVRECGRREERRDEDEEPGEGHGAGLRWARRRGHPRRAAFRIRRS